MGETSRLTATEPYGDELGREPSRARSMGVFLEAMSTSSFGGSRGPRDGAAIASVRPREARSWPDVKVEDEDEDEDKDRRERCEIEPT